MRNLKFQFCIYASLLSILAISCSKENETVVNIPSVVKLLKAEVSYYDEGHVDSIAYFYSTDSILLKVENWKKSPSTEIVLDRIYDFTYNAGRLIKVDDNGWVNNARYFHQRDSIIYDSQNRPEKLYLLEKEQSSTLVIIDSTGFEYNSSNLPYKFAYNSTSYGLWEYSGGNVAIVKEYVNNLLRGDAENYQYDNKMNPYRGNNYYFGEPEYYSANNWTKQIDGDDIENRTYEYDSDGYPVSVVWYGETLNENQSNIKYYYK